VLYFTAQPFLVPDGILFLKPILKNKPIFPNKACPKTEYAAFFHLSAISGTTSRAFSKKFTKSSQFIVDESLQGRINTAIIIINTGVVRLCKKFFIKELSS